MLCICGTMNNPLDWIPLSVIYLAGRTPNGPLIHADFGNNARYDRLAYRPSITIDYAYAEFFSGAIK